MKIPVFPASISPSLISIKYRQEIMSFRQVWYFKLKLTGCGRKCFYPRHSAAISQNKFNFRCKRPPFNNYFISRDCFVSRGRLIRLNAGNFQAPMLTWVTILKPAFFNRHNLTAVTGAITCPPRISRSTRARRPPHH